MTASPPLSISKGNSRRFSMASRLTTSLFDGSHCINKQSVGIQMSTTGYASTFAPLSMPSCAKAARQVLGSFAQSPAQSSGIKMAVRSYCAPKKIFPGSGVGTRPTNPWLPISAPQFQAPHVQGTASMAIAGMTCITPEPPRKPLGLSIEERVEAWHHTPCWMH